MRVMARDGREWRIGRRWLPWRPRRRRFKDDSGNFDLPFEFDDSVAGFLLVLVVVAAVVLIFLPLLEILLLLVLVVTGAVGRFLFRRPWSVVAETDRPPPARLQWSVVGWRESGELIDEIAQELRSQSGLPSPGGRRPDLVEVPD